jgi:predicted DCC family thiol-disulfide oxidoreductase YuxK
VTPVDPAAPSVSGDPPPGITPIPKDAHQIVLFDGTCGFCDASVQWLLDKDRPGVLRFAPLQGPSCAALRAAGAPIPSDMDTVVLLTRAPSGWRAHLRSDAAVEICARLPAPWRHLAALRWVPRPLRDLGYRAVAAVRYRIWGRVDACRLPAPDEAARFLP